MKFTNELNDLFPLLQSTRSELTIDECDAAKSIGLLCSLHVLHLHLFCIAPYLAQESFRLLHSGVTSLTLRADLRTPFDSSQLFSHTSQSSLKRLAPVQSIPDNNTPLPPEIDLRTHHFMAGSVLDDCCAIIEHELARRDPSTRIPLK